MTRRLFQGDLTRMPRDLPARVETAFCERIAQVLAAAGVSNHMRLHFAARTTEQTGDRRTVLPAGMDRPGLTLPPVPISRPTQSDRTPCFATCIGERSQPARQATAPDAFILSGKTHRQPGWRRCRVPINSERLLPCGGTDRHHVFAAPDAAGDHALCSIPASRRARANSTTLAIATCNCLIPSPLRLRVRRFPHRA